MKLPSLNNESPKMPALDSLPVETKPPVVEEKDTKQVEAKLDRFIEIFGSPLSRGDEQHNEFHDTGYIGRFHLDMVLSDAIETGASDIHITADQVVCFTVLGDIKKHSEYPIPDSGLMYELIQSMLKHQDIGVYVKDLDYDFAYKIKYGPYKGRRFRGNVGKSFGSDFLVMRTISEEIPSMGSLDIEQDNEMVQWSHLPNGLWMICGATGSGKSTTLASIVRDMQLTQSKKVITIERPIEYVYPEDGKALIVQRAVGEDCLSFYHGLTAAMRQNPDIILLGEVRNTEEISELIRAAETGHLAISTMHTNSVATTINRVQSLFTGNEQQRIMSTLADTMRGLGNQILVKTKDGKARFAVRELLSVNAEIKKLIGAGNVAGIRDYQMRHKITMEHKLLEAVQAGLCTYKEAKSRTAYPEDFNMIAKEMGIDKRM